VDVPAKLRLALPCHLEPLSPRDNPGHYWLPAIGLALTALLMLPFAGHLRRHLEVASPRVARMSSGAFVAGSIALICACFVVPQHLHDVFGVRRLHEFLARSAARSLAIGMLCGCWSRCSTGWHFRERIFIVPYPTESVLGDADPQRAEALRILAPWFLGMDGAQRQYSYFFARLFF